MKKYIITDKYGRQLKKGTFSEPEVRMAAKAGMRIFELDDSGGMRSTEITQDLTDFFNGYN